MTYLSGVRFEALEVWRKQNKLYLSQAAEAFGLNVPRWATLLKKNDLVRNRRILRLFILYQRAPNVLIQQGVDYQQLYNSFHFLDESTADHISFARLLGVSRSSSYRILEENHAGRVVRNYVLAVKRLNVSTEKALSIMDDVARLADIASENGKKELAAARKKIRKLEKIEEGA
ncbi:TPA: hypothetical protein ACF3I9_004419 [Klebsiella aerogenes]